MQCINMYAISWCDIAGGYLLNLFLMLLWVRHHSEFRDCYVESTHAHLLLLFWIPSRSYGLIFIRSQLVISVGQY